jgi:carboxymethylenebutenolidase
LAACRLSDIDAAVDCWGGGVAGPPDRLTPRQPVDPVDYTADLGCPLLGLFGEEDPSPSPEEVAKTEEELKRHGKTYEFHMYPDAGHGFFAVDRPSYRQHAAVDGWGKVLAWFDKYLN